MGEKREVRLRIQDMRLLLQVERRTTNTTFPNTEHPSTQDWVPVSGLPGCTQPEASDLATRLVKVEHTIDSLRTQIWIHNQIHDRKPIKIQSRCRCTSSKHLRSESQILRHEKAPYGGNVSQASLLRGMMKTKTKINTKLWTKLYTKMKTKS